MFHLWGLDINDPSVTVRRLWAFFSRLPSDSQTINDINEVPRMTREWNVNTWMLANVIDALQAVDWHIIAANSKRTPKPPKPFPRPETKKRIVSKKMWPGKTIVDKGKING